MTQVTKAVIAAAGFGTRFLPQTKAMPKEMLPLVNKPIIQYIVEDLVEAGIKDIIIVGSSNKRSIEDHFDMPSEDLLANLKAGGPKKQPYIDEIEKIANLANFIYVRQKGRYGTATPVSNVAHLLGDEPFIYTFADDLIVSRPNSFQQMIDIHEQYGGSVISCFEVNEDKEYGRYGIVGGEQVAPGLIKMDRIIEKPGREKAPSNFASGGAFLFTTEMLPYLEKGLVNLPDDQEYYLSDRVVQPMLRDGKDVYGFVVPDSIRYDTGDKLEYMRTVIDFALRDPEIGEDIRKFLKTKDL